MMLRCEVTVDDLIALNRYYSQHSQAVKWRKWSGSLFCSLILFSVAFLVPAEDEAQRYAAIAIVAVIAVGFAIYCSRTYDRDVDRMAWKFYSESKGMAGEVELVIDEEGITERRENGVTHSSWEDVQKIVETEDYCFIFFSPIQAYLVPRNAVQSGLPDQFINQAKKFWRETNPEKGV